MFTGELQHASRASPGAADLPFRPQSFDMPARHCVAGHLSRASLELLEVLSLDAKRPQCLLEPLGVIFEALEPS